MSNVPTDIVLLKELNLFKGLNSKDLARIKKYLNENSFKKGEMIFSEGDSCERILIVRSGRIKLFRLSSGGREQILEVLERGDTCACNPGSMKWKCSASAQALSDGSLWILSRNEYVKLVRSNHRLMQQLNEIFANRICRLCSLIEEVSLNSSQKRLVKFILDMAEEQNGTAEKEGIPFTHDEISLRLGLVRETVTRHLSRLKKDKLIDMRSRQIIIKDKAGLQKFLQ